VNTLPTHAKPHCARAVELDLDVAQVGFDIELVPVLLPDRCALGCFRADCSVTCGLLLCSPDTGGIQ
jgi:hypothetical protein